jgi:hypothetical protein
MDSSYLWLIDCASPSIEIDNKLLGLLVPAIARLKAGLLGPVSGKLLTKRVISDMTKSSVLSIGGNR